MSWIGLRVYRGLLRGSGAHGEADVVLELLFKGSNIELSERMRDIILISLRGLLFSLLGSSFLPNPRGVQ